MNIITIITCFIIVFACWMMWQARKKWRFRMLKHYIEYVFMGDHCTTAIYGPLDDLTANGLLKEIEKQGGKVLYHRSGTSKEMHELLLHREVKLVESGLQDVIEKHYKDNLNF